MATAPDDSQPKRGWLRFGRDPDGAPLTWRDIRSGINEWVRDRSAAQLFTGSFFLLVVLGTLALWGLPGLYTGEDLGFVDSLFMSTSAVCVTGLSVSDLETQFTFFGQVVMLTLIQIGGLGIIAFASLIILALGRRLTLDARDSAGSELVDLPNVTPRQLVFGIFLYAFSFEFITAVGLFLLWREDLGVGEALWSSIFHAVSGFCQAGFSINSDSLMGWNDSPMTLIVAGLPVLVGGLGFLTIEDIRRRVFWKRHRLALHTKVVVTATIALFLLGMGVFLIFEWDGVLSGMSLADHLANAGFMSVSARSVGFNSIDHAQASYGTNFFTVILMFIGGGPGGTAGGIKITTFAVIGLLAWSRLRGRQHVTVFNRTIPDETIQRATGLVMAFGTVTIVCLLVLTRTEDFSVPGHTFLAYLFEVVSALGNVGLGMGVTGDLSTTGKLVIIVAMFAGRVGPITLISIFAHRNGRRRDRFRYANGEVILG
ncbi:MAG: potassium transporter TrkG [Planctomycetota bacterium]